MRILITGVCGFAGSEIALRLREHKSCDSLQIIGIDNLSRNGSWRNWERLRDADISVQHGDIRNSTDVGAVGDVDWILDAAANPSVLAGVDGKSSSRQLVDYNLAGTVNLLEHCKEYGAGFTLLSTSRVYSISALAGLRVAVAQSAFQLVAGALPIGVSAAGVSESFSTTAPVSLYGATKLASEQLALEYGYAFGFPVWINRCGVLSGAGQFGKADQGIFSFWLHSWKERRPLAYIGFGGSGHQVRDCLHPRDLVSLLLKQWAAEEQSMVPIVNVSGGADSAMSLAQLSSWCEDRWGPREIGVHPEQRPFDLPWIVLDSSLAAETWGWRSESSTSQILCEIAEFAESQNDWIGFSQ